MTHATSLHVCLLVFVCQYVYGGNGLLEWISRPQNAAIVKGQDLVFDCLVGFVDDGRLGDRILYSWSFEGGPVASKTSLFANHSLLLPRIEDADLGTYFCTTSLLDSDGGLAAFRRANATIIEAGLEPFVIHPTSQVLNLGAKLLLTCVSGRSAPSLEVYWTRDGQKLEDGDQLTAAFGDKDKLGLSRQTSMRFETTASHDSVGVYQCVAVNRVSGQRRTSLEAEISLALTPTDNLPEIEWNLPEELVIAEGQELVLSCKSQASSEPVRTDWFLGRYLVDESKRVYVLANTSLAFLPLSARDKGTYRCRLTNSKGSTWSPEIKLVIAYLDTRFLEEPSDTTALYGQTVVLPCRPPASLPTAQVLWYKDFAPFNPAARPGPAHVDVSGSLHLTSLTSADQGQYYCVALNSMTRPSTRTSRVATLNVEGPPEMVQPPASTTTLIRGALLHLSCRAVANPTPVVTWAFQGRPVVASTTVSIVDRGQELWITNVGNEWSGTFTCLCANKYGSTSAQASVTVVVPPSSLHAIGDLRVKAGNRLTLTCPISGSPQPAIQWFHNGSEIETKTDVSGSPAYTQVDPTHLVVDPVTPHHSGGYLCKGSNGGGSATSEGRVVVLVPPHFLEAPSHTTVILGHPLQLVCKAGGNPQPSLQWKFNDSLAMLPGILSPDNTSLSNAQTVWDMVGSYTCEASNGFGTATHTASVKLLVPPNVSSISHPESPVPLGHRITLSCHVTGIPTPVVTWSLQGAAVTPTLDGRVRFPSGNVLEVESAQLSDSGSYGCQAASVAGTDRKLVTVDVYGPPVPPSLTNAVPVTPSSVFLIWTWPGSQQASYMISGFRVFVRERSRDHFLLYPEALSSNATRLEVKGLKPVTTYVFYVSAVNDAGQSQGSNRLSAVTLQSEPSSPTNLRAEKVTARTAVLTWEVPLDTNGDLELYQLKFRRQDDLSAPILVNISNIQIPTQEYELDSLRPFFTYEAQVRAATVHEGVEMWGDYSTLYTFQTHMTVPALPPPNVRAVVLDAFSVRISWEEIPTLAQNGPTIHYYVRCIDEDSNVISQSQTNSSVRTLKIRGLHPWRRYAVLVSGENPVGKGPESGPEAFRTLSIAPVAVPRDVAGQAMSADAIKLSWKPLLPEDVTCNITAYEVEFKVEGSATWSHVSVPSNMTTFVIRNLVAWTVYQLRVAASTEAVSPGLGSFTDNVVVKTQEGESLPVTALSYSSNATTLTLTWRPPVDVKGVLAGFSLAYSLVEPQIDNQTLTLDLPSQRTSAHLHNLTPSSLYSVSISAVNGAGRGKSSVILFRTEHLATTAVTLPDSTHVVTTVAVTGTAATAALQQQAMESHVKKNLAAIVAGSIVGSICLIAITIFFCLKCKQYRQKQRLSYVVEPEDGGPHIRTESFARTLSVPATSPEDSTTPNPTDPQDARDSSFPVATPDNPKVMTSNADTVQGQTKSGDYARQTPPDSALDIVDHQNRQDLPSVDNSSAPSAAAIRNGKGLNRRQSGSKKRKLLSMPHLPKSGYSKFDDDGEISTAGVNGANDDKFYRPRATTTNVIIEGQVLNDDTISVQSETLKKRTRMRSESAAAIAALRSSQVVSLPDTDVLVDNDSQPASEVIFNERTVL